MQETLQFSKVGTAKFKLNKPLSIEVLDNGIPADAPITDELRLHIYDRCTNVKFLVDSGSVVSLVPRQLIKDRLSKQELVLYAANNTRIPTYGRRMLTLNLGLRRAITWPFIIADVKSAIIGADLLAHSGLIVDVKRRKLHDPTTALSQPGTLQKAPAHSISVVSGAWDISESVKKLLIKHSAVTQPVSPVLEQDSRVQHRIITTGQPVVERPRRLIGEKREAAEKFFKELIQVGTVRPSSSQWANPLHMVRKPNGGWRATGDYRRLNSQTIPDRYPLPRIEDLLHRLHGRKVFSTIDLVRAFNQIPVAPEDVQKTAITTPLGLFEYCGMPLGLRNASQTFQRYMDNILKDLPFVSCFIDDLIIASDTMEEHLRHLEIVFEKLIANRLWINLEKCQFAKSTVHYLGYTVDEYGYLPPQKKVQAIVDFAKPKTISDLRRFVGMLNYYRCCIPHAAETQAPLCALFKDSKKKDKRPVPWTAETLKAFEDCKNSIVTAAKATFLNPDAPLALTCDASNISLGASLEQFEDNKWKPLGFFSRKLSPAETRYSTYDRELLAIFAALKFFKHLVEGREFVIKTDHKPITFALHQVASKASDRQLRQLDFIAQFNAPILHVKGEQNYVADALSRVDAIGMDIVLDATSISEAQLNDELPAKTSLKLQQVTIDGKLIWCDIGDNLVRPYLPPALRKTAFNLAHGLSHSSGRSTLRSVRSRYVWPSMNSDILRWARECIPCQKAKISRHTRSLPRRIDVPDHRLSHVHLDIVKLSESQGYAYCLTMIDRTTRWPHAVPMRNMLAETVAREFYRHWISMFGTPQVITTDQGTQFESELFQELTKFIGAHRIHTTPYHPQANGLIESWHRPLKAALMCNPGIPWPDLLPAALLGLRTSFKEDLGCSAAEMLFGLTLRLPGDFFVPDTTRPTTKELRDGIQRHFAALTPVPTSRHSTVKPFISKDLQKCTHVFRRVDQIKKALTPPYSGPHKIIRRLDDKTFLVDIDGTEKTLSVDSLKPAHIAKDEGIDVPPEPAATKPAATATKRPGRPPKKVTFSLPSSADEDARGGVPVASCPANTRVTRSMTQRKVMEKTKRKYAK